MRQLLKRLHELPIIGVASPSKDFSLSAEQSAYARYLRVYQLFVVGLNAKNRLHTAPPLPAFIHCAHEAVQPPLVAPAQFKSLSSIPTQLPDAGKPTLCKISGGSTTAEPEFTLGVTELTETTKKYEVF
jgi:hypothetical protein